MLKKIKEIKFNFALLAFVSYVIKMLILEPGYSDAIVIAVLAGLYGFKMKLQLMEPKKIDESTKKDVQEIKNALSKVNLAKIADPKKYF
jgi:hypothetical protein